MDTTRTTEAQKIMSQVVAITAETGTILDTETYDPRNDAGRPSRIAAAAAIIAERQAIAPPDRPLRSRAVVADGIEWGIMTSADVRPGMVEVAWGKWGFEGA